MPDLVYISSVSWKGTGRAGAGLLATGAQTVTFSAPANMGGRGIGTSPEELLISAAASCYSGTLVHLLARDRLPAEGVEVIATGRVSDYPGERARFSEITVNPTILGGDPERRREYITTARLAREHCFIGQTLRADIRYEVGDVSVRSSEAPAAAGGLAPAKVA